MKNWNLGPGLEFPCLKILFLKAGEVEGSSDPQFAVWAYFGDMCIWRHFAVDLDLVLYIIPSTYLKKIYACAVLHMLSAWIALLAACYIMPEFRKKFEDNW